MIRPPAKRGQRILSCPSLKIWPSKQREATSGERLLCHGSHQRKKSIWWWSAAEIRWAMESIHSYKELFYRTVLALLASLSIEVIFHNNWVSPQPWQHSVTVPFLSISPFMKVNYLFLVSSPSRDTFYFPLVPAAGYQLGDLLRGCCRFLHWAPFEFSLSAIKPGSCSTQIHSEPWDAAPALQLGVPRILCFHPLSRGFFPFQGSQPNHICRCWIISIFKLEVANVHRGKITLKEDPSICQQIRVQHYTYKVCLKSMIWKKKKKHKQTKQSIKYLKNETVLYFLDTLTCRWQWKVPRRCKPAIWIQNNSKKIKNI